jgi:cell division transport system permease protein
VYLEDELYGDSVKCGELIKEIERFDEVDSLYLVGKDEAWWEFENNYGAEMLDAINENPLPARLDITLSRKQTYSDAVDTLKRKLQQFSGIEGVNYLGELLSKLEKFNTIFVWGTSIIVVVLLLALHFMIANTVKLTIYARKDLIVNMQYVGATDLFIKTPFVLEGVLQGMIGGVAGIFFLSVLKLFLYRFSLYWGDWYFFPALFFVGVLFGWLGSTSAVRRFLI